MKEKEIFKKMLLDDSYIKWLSEFMKDRNLIDNLYSTISAEDKISSDDIKRIEYLGFLYVELLIYFAKNGNIINQTQPLCMKYKNKYYVLTKESNFYLCNVYNGQLYIDKESKWIYTNKCFDYLEPMDYIEYEELKKQYNMQDKAIANNIKTTNLNELINKIIEYPRDFYVKICNALTPEERAFIIKILENKNCLNCTNPLCRIEHIEKIGLDEHGNYQGSKCICWSNDELIGKSKVLGLTDINKLK